jgi:hypothetical protein
MRFAIACTAFCFEVARWKQQNAAPHVSDVLLGWLRVPKAGVRPLGTVHRDYRGLGRAILILETFLTLQHLDRPRYGDGVRPD